MWERENQDSLDMHLRIMELEKELGKKKAKEKRS